MTYAHEKLAERYRGRPAARAVLWRLARRAKSNGCWSMSIAELVEDTGYSDKTVRAALKTLVGEELIQRRARYRKNSSRAEDEFVVTVDRLGGAETSTGPSKNFQGPLEEVPPLTSFDVDPDGSDLPNGRSDPEKPRAHEVSNLVRLGPIDARRLQRLLASAADARFDPPPDLAAAIADAAAARSGAGPPRSRLPADWKPHPAEVAMARDLGLTPPEIDDATAQFRSKWTAQWGQAAYRSDWRAEWCVWVRVFAALVGRPGALARGAGGFRSRRRSGSFASIIARSDGYDPD